MERFFHEELQGLKGKVLEMGALAAQAISQSIQALLERDETLAKEVLDREKEINRLEIEIDEEGHGDIALGQPLAGDLRLVTSILKINTDLERMGDHAVNIAERVRGMSREPRLERYLGIPEMAQAAIEMLEDALDSFRKEDPALARSVLERDDVVDRYNDELYAEAEKIASRNSAVARSGMNLILIGHNLERIADLATNIAENVIYLKEGKEVRHRLEDPGS